MESKIFIICLILLSIGMADVCAESVQENKMGFILELYYGDMKPVLDYENVDFSKPLMLKIVSINGYERWVKVPNIASSITCKREDELQDCYNRDHYEDIDIFIPPKDNVETFIILESYNDLDPKKKLGNWKIEYNPTIYNAICFEDDTLEKVRNCDIDIIPVNPLKFEVRADVPSVSERRSSFDEFYQDYIVKYKYLWSFLGVVIAALSVLVIRRRG
jgi:hypothetical protein